jgi:hypothetical protein
LRENPVLKQALEVFVIRMSGGRSYGWEIRQFGGVVIDRAEASFGTPAEAQEDGGRVLAGRLRDSAKSRLP